MSAISEDMMDAVRKREGNRGLSVQETRQNKQQRNLSQIIRNSLHPTTNHFKKLPHISDIEVNTFIVNYVTPSNWGTTFVLQW